MNIASMAWSTNANGPWRRMVTHFQGCSLACPGCFNKHLWSTKKQRMQWEPSELATHLLDLGVKHFTFSGGEPFEQGVSFLRLLRLLRKRSHTCTIMVFTGYSLEELEEKYKSTSLMAVLGSIDVLVAGRFKEELVQVGKPSYASSTNQVVIPLTNRISMEQLTRIPGVEILVDFNGESFMTGFPVPGVVNAIQELSK